MLQPFENIGFKKSGKKCCPILTSLVSGSPILQNGKIVGAVTHVLVDDPTSGYGIYVGRMLQQCDY